MSGWKTWDEEKYHPNWGKRKRKELKRAKGHCDFCHAEKGTLRPKTRRKVMLAVAHLNHDTKNARALLAVLCQRCHTLWDAENHGKNRHNSNKKDKEKTAIDRGQLTTNLKLRGNQDKLKMKNRTSVFVDTAWRIRMFLLMLQREKARNNRRIEAEQLQMFDEHDYLIIQVDLPISQFLQIEAS